jgi:hypothetical protein
MLRRAYLEQVTGKVLLIFNLEGDLLALGCDRSSRLDFVIPVTTSVTVGSHDDDVLSSASYSDNEVN